MSNRPDEWYNTFWSYIDPDEDAGTSAVRLIGEMLALGLIHRRGDFLRGVDGEHLNLDAGDQYLVRCIEEAVGAANEEVGA